MRPTLRAALLLLLLAQACGSGVEVGGSYDDKGSASAAEEAHDLLTRGAGQHSDNWAVLVCTSRFWFNYRHIANTLAVYRTVKRLGMPDSHIILMLADDMACNPRNSEPGTVYTDDSMGDIAELYGDDIEVDYKGYEVTVESFIRVLTGRHPEGTPPSKRLQTTERSNILIYMTGHGGDEFLKFQDAEEISSRDIADSFAQMWQKRRYNEILFMADTCQAGTLASHFYSPQILAVGSSSKDENSYSYGHSQSLGVSLVDRFTFKILDVLHSVSIGSSARLLDDMLRQLHPSFLMSTPVIVTRLWRHRPLKDVLVTDFFGATGASLLGSSVSTDLRLPRRAMPVHSSVLGCAQQRPCGVHSSCGCYGSPA